ncbi:MAG: GDSL family lipase [Fibrobacter sp.]|nr:GDSL family lipase [Fibrobacter sp.]
MYKIGVLSLAVVTSLFAAGKVACVGNSITYGYGIESWPDETSYPHHLQTFLRAEGGSAASDTVGNFGVSGLAIRKSDNAAYWNGYQFTPALDFAADTVIIGLGTNDTKSYNAWISAEQNAALDEEIFTDFKSMIDTFQVQSKPRVFICLAPYANNSEWGILDTALVNHVIPAALKAGIEKGVNIIDLHSNFSYLEHPSWYLSDMVHPSVEGAKELAKIIYSYVQKDNLSVSQNKNVLSAPTGYDYQWYKDGVKIEGATEQNLLVSENGEYKVSVKIEENTLSRIVTHPYTVSDLDATALFLQKANVSSVHYAGGIVSISLSQKMPVVFKLMDAQGRVLQSRTVQGQVGENAISIGKYPAGNYIFWVQGKVYRFQIW